MGERLRKGQRPFEKLVHLRTAHDVRKIKTCAHCQRIGTNETMVDTSAAQWWHGRCYVKHFGLERLLQEDSERLDRLSLGDLGVELCRLVIDGRPAKP